MATINYSFVPQTGYTGNYTVKAYKATAPNTEVASIVRSPAYTNPVVGTLTVTTYEAHIVRVFGCNNKMILEFNVTPPSATCPFPGAPVMSSITTTTATATWDPAPVPPAAGYDWELLLVEAGVAGQVQNGNTALLTINLTGMTPGKLYRFQLKGKCGDEVFSNPVSTDFETESDEEETTGTVTLHSNLAGGGTVIIRSTTNLNQYTVDTTGASDSLSVPFDEYEIMSFSFHDPCSSASITPPLNSKFTLNAGTPTKDIYIECTDFVCYHYSVEAGPNLTTYNYRSCDGTYNANVTIDAHFTDNICAQEDSVTGAEVTITKQGEC